MPMQQHFVTFLSPGTFLHEQTTKPIDSWDVETVKRMASDIIERYNAKPFGFYFSTDRREDDELNSKQVARSAMYYLGGKIETLAEVKARNDPSERILIANMEGNNWDRIIVNMNSWKVVQPLEADDIVLDYDPAPLEV